jgi:hypothetical protein
MGPRRRRKQRARALPMRTLAVVVQRDDGWLSAARDVWAQFRDNRRVFGVVAFVVWLVVWWWLHGL